jgi:hypothetical protein
MEIAGDDSESTRTSALGTQTIRDFPFIMPPLM